MELDEPTFVVLHERTEGWAAGLRLAALTLAGGADPGRFAAEFFRQRADGRGVPLRYLPTNLSAPEIARELLVSPNTVKTHIRPLYAKFGTHHRAEAVDLARALGLLAPTRTSPASR